jgi:hypothetical protein
VSLSLGWFTLFVFYSATVIGPKCPSVRFPVTMFSGRFADTATPGTLLCMLAKTHPDQASPVDPLFGFAGKRVDPLFGFAGKRVKKLIFNFYFPLSNAVEERDVGRSLDRVSLSLG